LRASTLKTSVYIATTLDGFIARKNGELDWLPGSDGKMDENHGNEDYGYNSFMDSIDVLVMGKNTYELVLSSGNWPYGSKKVIVLSKTLNQLADKTSNSVEIKSCSPKDLYAELEVSGAKHIYIDGGKTIQGFLEAGLINEITITKVPVIIGSGIPLFGPLSSDIHLRPLEAKSFQNGFVQNKYEIIKMK